MVKRIFKDHTCKADGCNNVAAKDSHGLHMTYCSDKCNPTKKLRICVNEGCTNPQPKNAFGNYTRYCSETCMKIGRQLKFDKTYAGKDIDAITEKRKETCNEIYGVDNVFKTKEIKDILKTNSKEIAVKRVASTKKNNKKNYGVESTNSLQRVKDLKKNNYAANTGFEHPLKNPIIAASVSKKNTANAPKRLAKASKTKQKIYGDKNYNNRTQFKETCFERFGVENPSQNSEIHAKKIKYRRKKFIFPSGRLVWVQGNEPEALTELLKTYHENDIVVETVNIPRIKYIGCDGKIHYYFPDIYIPKENLLIEVKSKYYYNGFIGWHRTNMRKQKYTLLSGYNFKFMIYDKKAFYNTL